MTAFSTDEPLQAFDEQTWREVVAAMDRTYSELVDYQEILEKQNRQIEDMRQFMASVLASVSDALIVIGKDRRIERAEGPIEKILGRSSEACLGQAVQELVAPGEEDALLEMIDQVMRDCEPRVLECQFSTPDGPAPLEISLSTRLDQRGRSQGVVLVGRPLGELRNAYRELEASHMALQQAQSQLVKNEKLASLGRLVAGVAHELNNPISFVYANTHALEKYTARFETYFDAVQAGKSRPALVALRDELRLDRTVRNLRTAITGAKEGAERVRDIVKDLRRLSAEGSGEHQRFNLAETARIAAEWVVRGTKTPVRVRFQDASEIWTIGNPGHVQQIAMNLVQNAIDALTDTQDPAITLHVFRRDEGAVLQVADNGPGIPDSVAPAIFDPFYTTKEVGKGTGLGLAISHKIAEEHGGTLILAKTGPEGSCFELTLPTEDGP
ncbi:MAG: ATP-binding protein [Mangrovicoccus sp.]|nr:ATP-binding protein [Mangrovicoccus sp.]